jgi:hypothetical protein
MTGTVARPRIPSLAGAIAVLCLAAGSARADDKPAPRPLPLPTAGKAVAAAPASAQRVFRIPLGFARVERFYRETFGGDPQITITVDRSGSARVLTLTSKRQGDAWLRAVARENAVDTTIEVTPVVRIATGVIEGHAPHPLVQFVLPPNPEVARQAASIDHLGK